MINDLDDLLPDAPLPDSASALRRRLKLVALTNKLIEQQTGLAPDTAGFDMADSLATLMDEMEGEGVTADDIAALDVSDQSGHWARAQQFIGIAQTYIDASSHAPDAEARHPIASLLLGAGARTEPTALRLAVCSGALALAPV